jgi:hypothetical protein
VAWAPRPTPPCLTNQPYGLEANRLTRHEDFALDPVVGDLHKGIKGASAFAASAGSVVGPTGRLWRQALAEKVLALWASACSLSVREDVNATVTVK